MKPPFWLVYWKQGAESPYFVVNILEPCCHQIIDDADEIHRRKAFEFSDKQIERWFEQLKDQTINQIINTSTVLPCFSISGSHITYDGSPDWGS